MKNKLKKQLTGIIAFAIILVIAILLDKFNIIKIRDYLKVNDQQKTYEIKEANTVNNSELQTYEVIRVVDGDTFVIKYNGQNERVRLIGIDTPESVHPDEEKNTEFGEQVSKYSKEMLTGKKIVLEFDVEQRDKYGRLLAYVYLDGQMYNELLLKRGYAKLATYPPNVKYVEDFKALQKEARENKVGLWAY